MEGTPQESRSSSSRRLKKKDCAAAAANAADMKTEDAAMPEVSTAETAGIIREVCEAVFQEMLQPEAEPVVPWNSGH